MPPEPSAPKLRPTSPSPPEDSAWQNMRAGRPFAASRRSCQCSSQERAANLPITVAKLSGGSWPSYAFICEELRSTAPFGHGSVRSVGVHQSVLVGMMFHRFFGMIGGVQRVSVGDMGVMVLGRFPVMFGRVLMMLRRLEM